MGSYLFSGIWCRCAGLAMQHCPPSQLLFGSVEHPLTCSAHGRVIPGVMKCIRTIAPVWIKYKTFLLHLSLVVDTDIKAADRVGEVIHPRPSAPCFWICSLQGLSEPAIVFRPPWTCPLRVCLTLFENRLNYSIVHEHGKYPLGWWFC